MRFLSVISAIVLTPIAAFGQQPPAEQKQEPTQGSKRLFWIIPNYRTTPALETYKPLTVRQKFNEAAKDTFDPGTFALAAIVGAQSQLANANRTFGQGGAGFARYTGAAYGDVFAGNYLTEGIFPSLLHQDPRYFRRGTGSALSRVGYAVKSIFWTHRDSGAMQFNYSEIAGNSVAVAISNSYYADNRTVHDSVTKLGIQLGIDAFGSILEEFYPDLERKFRRKHRPPPIVPSSF